MLSEEYAKSEDNLALKQIPEARYLDFLDEARFPRESQTLEEKVMNMLGNLPGPTEAVLPLLKLKGMAKIAKDLLPSVIDRMVNIPASTKGMTPGQIFARRWEKAELDRLGGIWRGAVELPKKEWGRVYDVDMLSSVSPRLMGAKGSAHFPTKTPEGWKPSVSLALDKADWATVWHEFGGHGRQYVPEKTGPVFTLRESGVPVPNSSKLTEEDVVDVLWRMRTKLVENEARGKMPVWVYEKDPVEVHAKLVEKLVPGSNPSKYDENYALSLINALQTSKQNYPEIFRESLIDMLAEYPRKRWPLVPRK